MLLALVAAPARGDPAAGERFLVIYGQHSAQPSNIEIAAGIERVMSRPPAGRREIYTAYLDDARFPAEEHKARLADDLAAKFAGLPLDAVIAISPSATEFALAHRERFAPGAPLVLGAMTAETVSRLDLPDDVHAVLSNFDMEKTLDFALSAQPDASRIVVMTGSADFDRRWDERARAWLGERFRGVPVEHVSGLTFEGFAERAAALDRRAILLVLTVYRDADGSVLVPREATRAIAAASAAPVYSVYSSYIGAGALGGFVETFEAIGEAVASLALDVAARGEAAPRLARTEGGPVVDWREVVRFGIDGSRLPPETVRLFYAPTTWERYRVEILAAAAVILLQAATIAALLLQERRRRRMARALAAGRLELAHASRAAQLGELSGALAHELNQPLASILANAEAGSRLLRADPPDLSEIADILSDIAADDRRAAAIITDLRRLMAKGEAALETVELNDLAARTLALVRSELVARHIAADLRPGAPAVPVRASAPQIQQVLLNLVLNAAEAMAELPPEERRILVATGIRGDGRRELRVADRGPGVTAEAAAAAFRPFHTTKANGLGLGLPICRSIAEAHGGTLAFDFGATSGAAVVLTLPAPGEGGAG